MKRGLLFFICFVAACDSQQSSVPATATNTVEPPTEQTQTANQEPTAVAPAAASDRAVVFDFVDNRHLAHVYDGGLVMDLGAAQSLKYIQGSWNSPWYEGTKSEGMDFTYPKGVGGSLRFPLILPGAKGLTDEQWNISLKLKPVGKQRADLFFRSTNGEEKKIGSINEMKDGWGTYTVKLPAGYEIGQEHMLRVHFSRSAPIDGGRKSAAAIDWIKVGNPGNADEPGTVSTIFDAAAKRVTLKPGQRAIWFTMPAKTSQFSATVTGSPRVEVTDNAGKTTKIEAANGAITSDFSAWADQPVRIDFVNDSAAVATFENPSITVEKQQPMARGEKPQYVLVWLIDTLRADHMKLYNPKTDVETPNLDAFAKTAAVFRSGTVQGNSSLPTSASIFTAAYAPNHGMITEKAKLPTDHVVFGEAFKKAGFATALFSSNGYVSNSWGFARGFDVEVNPIRENRPSDTEYLWPEAFEWIKKLHTATPDKPALIYINTVDPHVPYDPPQEFLSKYHQGGKVGKVSPRGTGQLLHDMAGGSIKLSNEEAAYMHALYKGEITYNDFWFGKMLENLKELGILEKTMIIVTADHGEEFGEYGRFGHGVSVNQELIDVPFLISYLPWTSKGLRIDQDVEVVDILPTVIDAVGAEEPATLQGDSLVSMMLDPTQRYPRAAFGYHNTFLRSARIGDWKYQLFNGDKDPVYHLTDGKGGWDRDDIGDKNPLVRRMMRDTMAFQVGLDTKLDKRKHGVANNHSAALAKWLDSKGW
ncbi:MAG: sulfatase [bacterium]